MIEFIKEFTFRVSQTILDVVALTSAKDHQAAALSLTHYIYSQFMLD